MKMEEDDEERRRRYRDKGKAKIGEPSIYPFDNQQQVHTPFPAFGVTDASTATEDLHHEQQREQEEERMRFGVSSKGSIWIRTSNDPLSFLTNIDRDMPPLLRQLQVNNRPSSLSIRDSHDRIQVNDPPSVDRMATLVDVAVSAAYDDHCQEKDKPVPDIKDERSSALPFKKRGFIIDKEVNDSTHEPRSFINDDSDRVQVQPPIVHAKKPVPRHRPRPFPPAVHPPYDPEKPGSRPPPMDALCLSKLLTINDVGRVNGRLLLDPFEASNLVDEPGLIDMIPAPDRFERYLLAFDPDDREFDMSLRVFIANGMPVYYLCEQWSKFLWRNDLRAEDEIMFFRVFDENVIEDFFYVLRYFKKPRRIQTPRPPKMVMQQKGESRRKT